MFCLSWQWHRTGSRWSPVRTLPVAPLWSRCDLGYSHGIKAAANLRPTKTVRARNSIPGHESHGFELVTNGIQFYVIVNLGKTSLFTMFQQR